MSGGYILYIGYLSIAGILTPLHDVGNVYFESKTICEQTTHMKNVVDSYQPIVRERFPNQPFRIWCEPTRAAKQ